MKKLIIGLILIIVLSLSSHAHTNDKNTTHKNGVTIADVKSLIHQYMERVFGVNSPTLNDYYNYEGRHNPKEWDMEISVCKTRYGNPQNLTDKQYYQSMPKECLDWISERHDNPEKYHSLFYESIRKKFHKYPLKYKIKSIDRKENEAVIPREIYLVSLTIPDEKAEIRLDVYREITDPELMIVEINKVVLQ